MQQLQNNELIPLEQAIDCLVKSAISLQRNDKVTITLLHEVQSYLDLILLQMPPHGELIR